jgi:hypothetical protein
MLPPLDVYRLPEIRPYGVVLRDEPKRAVLFVCRYHRLIAGKLVRNPAKIKGRRIANMRGIANGRVRPRRLMPMIERRDLIRLVGLARSEVNGFRVPIGLSNALRRLRTF